MKKIVKVIFCLMLVFCLVGCGKKDKTSNIPVPKGNTKKDNPKFNYDDTMYTNPEEWPTGTFFDSVPSVASEVDDLAVVVTGDNGENEVYTMTIKTMTYDNFKKYADKLMESGFMCTRAGYWIVETEKDLPNNYSQCIANQDGIYIKANWYKSSVSSFNFQMSISNFNTDAN